MMRLKGERLIILIATGVEGISYSFDIVSKNSDLVSWEIMSTLEIIITVVLFIGLGLVLGKHDYLKSVK